MPCVLPCVCDSKKVVEGEIYNLLVLLKSKETFYSLPGIPSTCLKVFHVQPLFLANSYTLTQRIFPKGIRNEICCL